MARPYKPGLDYFSVYIDFFSDMKIKKLIRAIGGESIAVLMNLYTKIYENGYYIDFDDDLLFFISEELKFEEDYIIQVIKEIIKLEILDSDLFMKFGVLTSESIQDMFNKAVERRKNVLLINEIWLIDESVIHHEKKKIKPIFEKISIQGAETEKMINVNNNLVYVNSMYTQTRSSGVTVDNNQLVNVDNNQVNVSINSINDNNGTQTKTENKTHTENKTYNYTHNQSVDRPNGLSLPSNDEYTPNNDENIEEQPLYQGRLYKKAFPSMDEKDFIKIANAYPNKTSIDDAIALYKELANRNGFNPNDVITAIQLHPFKAKELTLQAFLEQYFK